jgi:hypothetical protein
MNKNPLACRKLSSYLELRMYGLVPYQLTGIQQGIQYGHSKDQYAAHVIEHVMNWSIDLTTRQSTYPDATNDESIVNNYLDWLTKWKTYIVLNGGTTNSNPNSLGTLNQHLQTLKDNGIFCSEFYEPDLGDQLTGIDFLVDERVFNKEKYPNFEFQDKQTDLLNPTFASADEEDKWNTWVRYIGGKKNLFLRVFLSNFRLA